MCVIIVSPRGRSLPGKNELRMAALYNPDGFGFVSETASYKTLDFEDFWLHLSRVPRSENCIIHLRYATHGSVCVRNCHPFYGDDIWFAHNGVLPVRPQGDMTDSEHVFRNHLLPVIRTNGLVSPKTDRAVAEIIGSSKFAIMEKGNIHLYGSFTEHKGRYYSNTRHLR